MIVKKEQRPDYRRPELILAARSSSHQACPVSVYVKPRALHCTETMYLPHHLHAYYPHLYMHRGESSLRDSAYHISNTGLPILKSVPQILQSPLVSGKAASDRG